MEYNLKHIAECDANAFSKMPKSVFSIIHGRRHYICATDNFRFAFFKSGTSKSLEREAPLFMPPAPEGAIMSAIIAEPIMDKLKWICADGFMAKIEPLADQKCPIMSLPRKAANLCGQTYGLSLLTDSLEFMQAQKRGEHIWFAVSSLRAPWQSSQFIGYFTDGRGLFLAVLPCINIEPILTL